MTEFQAHVFFSGMSYFLHVPLSAKIFEVQQILVFFSAKIVNFSLADAWL